MLTIDYRDNEKKMTGYQVEIYENPNLCQPAVRMVVVYVSAWLSEEGYPKSSSVIYQVVALQCAKVSTYYKETPTGTNPSEPYSHKEAIEKNWRFANSETRNEPLIVYGEHGEILSPDVVFGESLHDEGSCIETMWMTFTCTWEPSEDEKMLSKHIENMKEEMIYSLTKRDSEHVTVEAAQGD